MSNACPDNLELIRLRQENQQLSEQVKRLVSTERRMIESQNQLDRQIALYRQLNEVGKRFGKTFSIAEILRHTMQFVIYELNFERCLILRAGESGQFQVDCWDGYDEVPEGITIQGTEQLICAADCADADLRELGQRLGMDEFVVFAASPEFLMAIGNTAPRFKYHARIREEDNAVIGLGNLIAQTTAALNQATLYAQVRDRADALEQTLKELQQTQTRLIQSEKMSGLGQLVAGVAHEINNPVNFISGNIQYLDDYARELLLFLQLYQRHYPAPVPEIQAQMEEIDLDFLQQDMTKLLASMTMGVDRIKNIVASLRTFSRMDEADYKQVDIHEGIESTLLILQHRMKASGSYAGITVLQEYGAIPPVECFAGQLNQVFMNILSNAIDALAEVSDATIRITTGWSGNDAVSIRIADNGSGIPEAVRSRIFDPFFTTKPIGKGTGLGLSISYQIITERHRGTLECISTPGAGTTFLITIPLLQLEVRKSY
jgi:signal transduction histidine kinase